MRGLTAYFSLSCALQALAVRTAQDRTNTLPRMLSTYHRLCLGRIQRKPGLQQLARLLEQSQTGIAQRKRGPKAPRVGQQQRGSMGAAGKSRPAAAAEGPSQRDVMRPGGRTRQQHRGMLTRKHSRMNAMERLAGWLAAGNSLQGADAMSSQSTYMMSARSHTQPLPWSSTRSARPCWQTINSCTAKHYLFSKRITPLHKHR